MSSWDIVTDADGTITVDAVEPPPPTRTRGTEVSMRVRPTSTTDYETLVDYIEYAGTAATGQVWKHRSVTSSPIPSADAAR